MNAPSETRLTGSGRFTGRVMKDRFGCRRELLWRIDLQVDAPSGGQISMVDIRLPVRTWQDLPGTHVADVPRTRRPADGEFHSEKRTGRLVQLPANASRPADPAAVRARAG